MCEKMICLEWKGAWAQVEMKKNCMCVSNVLQVCDSIICLHSPLSPALHRYLEEGDI